MFFDDDIKRLLPEAKRRSTEKRKPSHYSDRKQVGLVYGSRLILRENIRWRRYTAHQWLRNNKLGIHFIWQQFMLSENPGGESTTIRQKVSLLITPCLDVRQPNMIFKLLRFGSPIISQIWVYLREIVDLYKGIFARIAKKLSTTVLNLIVVSISLTAIFSNVGIRLGNYLRVCGPVFAVEVFKTLHDVRQSDNFSVSGLFTRNSRVIQ